MSRNEWPFQKMARFLQEITSSTYGPHFKVLAASPFCPMHPLESHPLVFSNNPVRPGHSYTGKGSFYCLLMADWVCSYSGSFKVWVNLSQCPWAPLGEVSLPSPAVASGLEAVCVVSKDSLLASPGWRNWQGVFGDPYAFLILFYFYEYCYIFRT